MTPNAECQRIIADVYAGKRTAGHVDPFFFLVLADEAAGRANDKGIVALLYSSTYTLSSSITRRLQPFVPRPFALAPF